jgi:hypothetical protein
VVLTNSATLGQPDAARDNLVDEGSIVMKRRIGFVSSVARGAFRDISALSNGKRGFTLALNGFDWVRFVAHDPIVSFQHASFSCQRLKTTLHRSKSKRKMRRKNRSWRRGENALTSMARKSRWLNCTVAAVVALVFCAAMSALAQRSTRCGDVISFRFGQRFGNLKSEAGSLHVMVNYVPGETIRDFTEGRDPVRYGNYRRGESRHGWSWRREWFSWHRAPPIDLEAYGGLGAMYTQLIVPHWFFILPSGVTGLWFARRAWHDRRQRRRQARGECTACGYDLRASPTCCPECGASCLT